MQALQEGASVEAPLVYPVNSQTALAPQRERVLSEAAVVAGLAKQLWVEEKTEIQPMVGFVLEAKAPVASDFDLG